MDILKKYKAKKPYTNVIARDLILAVNGKVSETNKKKICIIAELISK